MNDIEKAIGSLKMENELMQFDPMTGEDYPIELQNQDNQDLYKANLIAISALEKQIPKKPITEMKTDYRVSHKFRYCPNCKDILEPVTVNYCSTCGQKLDWSEVQK